jgi:hypothetical protein
MHARTRHSTGLASFPSVSRSRGHSLGRSLRSTPVRRRFLVTPPNQSSRPADRLCWLLGRPAPFPGKRGLACLAGDTMQRGEKGDKRKGQGGRGGGEEGKGPRLLVRWRRRAAGLWWRLAFFFFHVAFCGIASMRLLEPGSASSVGGLSFFFFEGGPARRRLTGKREEWGTNARVKMDPRWHAPRALRGWLAPETFEPRLEAFQSSCCHDAG